ncbi:MAG TPA: DUF1573 domain-containing protein [Opitutaceae bacterium]|jgi:hypothetical protein|nr:DUF1573 domain-containing protein [Opitutaceae bacterium]
MGPSAKSKREPSPVLAFRPILYRPGAISLQIVALACLLLRAAAQTPAAPQPPTPAAPPVPVITVEEKSFDFGEVRHGQTVVHGFKVSNTGHAILHIKEVHANCGCTSALIGKKDLEPGESTEIDAEFTPDKEFSGPVRKTILVVSDAPAHSKLILRFAADVPPDPAPAKPAP